MKRRNATAGNWLTQANLQDEQARTFATEVCGYGDLDTLFTEWTDAQKAEWEEEHKPEDFEEIDEPELPTNEI